MHRFGSFKHRSRLPLWAIVTSSPRLGLLAMLPVGGPNNTTAGATCDCYGSGSRAASHSSTVLDALVHFLTSDAMPALAPTSNTRRPSSNQPSAVFRLASRSAPPAENGMTQVAEKPLEILYLVHDLSDPAVAKRALMLRTGGGQVTVAGFRRANDPIYAIGECLATNLGRTYNRAFAQRTWSVLREAVLLSRHRGLFENADVVIARNLEMLALAVRGRGFCVNPPAIVYESLDIHYLLLARWPVGRGLRMVEAHLAQNAAALITSSPAFINNYFEHISRINLPMKLVENKVYNPGVVRRKRRPAEPPWKIGWFGKLRCSRSFGILAELAENSSGKINVIIRGEVDSDRIPHFDEIVKQTSGLEYLGPYRNPEDLAYIYREIHFTWTIHLCKEDAGLNSLWLLPNRLYEGGLYGVVPIAQADVETGRFVKHLGIGITLDAPLERSLRDFFGTLSPEYYGVLERAATSVPRSAWLWSQQDCRDLVAWLRALAGKADLCSEKGGPGPVLWPRRQGTSPAR